MKEFKLPSGAKAKIDDAPFADARELYQAVLEEMKAIKLDDKDNLANMKKDMFCTLLSSKKIEACIWKCFERVLIDQGKGLFKIDDQTFEPVKYREDYLTVCFETAKENIAPFVKPLYAELRVVFDLFTKDLA